MTLIKLIEFLEKRDPNIICPIGFNNPHSYKGFYNDVAFEPVNNITVRDMLYFAKEALGSTYQGYKGGDFIMDEFVDCYLAYCGSRGERIGPILLNYMVGETI